MIRDNRQEYYLCNMEAVYRSAQAGAMGSFVTSTWLLKVLFVFLLLSIYSCDADSPSPKRTKAKSVFTSIPATKSGLDFNNKVVETAEINYYKYIYLYNGGGVAIADINNDGLSDVYMSSTMGADKLYLNKGDFKFEDISVSSGISKFKGCKTGITFTDINDDGWIDIYVCRAGWSKNPQDRENLLFVNQQNGQFVESAKKYGLASDRYSIQSSFFDYDKDGDLDMYLSNHPAKFKQPLSQMVENVRQPSLEDSDRLYRNNGDGSFSALGPESGIINHGYGLGLVTADLNSDGWTDIYVTSDFDPNDSYFVNQKDGTFKESVKEYFPHNSYFAMGVDFVDINNDQHLDLFTGEMLSEENVRQKTQMAPMDTKRFSYMVDNGLHHQYMRNSFNLNNGNGHFSDIAHFSGIDKSDWSWSCLFGDYDLDGDDDLLVANGWLRDTQDKDFSKKSTNLAKKNNNKLSFEQAYGLLKSTPLKNYAFSYQGDYKFEKTSQEWGFDFEGFSNGMAYGDLDNDGDLDVIVNNMNAVASVYKNNSNSKNFIGFKLAGPKGNSLGLNARLTIETNQGKRFKNFHVTRGFESACEPRVHFGLSPNEEVQALKIVWADDQIQTMGKLKKGAYHEINYKPTGPIASNKKAPALFKTLPANQGLDFKHQEKIYNDFAEEVLIPHKLSQLGPSMAVGDLDNNGREDVFIGAAHGQASQIFMQDAQGNFKSKPQALLQADARYEDVCAVFFDADGDQDLDLYVGSGSNEYLSDQTILQDRLYLNDGNGVYNKKMPLPANNISTGTTAVADYNGDGRLDLLVGGRLVPGQYPNPPSSYLYKNTAEGFVDVTKKIAPALSKAGMLTSALWIDYDQDKDLDFVVVGEWTDILCFQNNDGLFDLASSTLLDKKYIGWWNVIKAADLDLDGDQDLVLGNLGENYKYQATDDKPFEVFASDLDENGKQDIVLGYYSGESLFPVRGFQCSSEQMPDLKKKFDSYESFGEADIFKVYGSEKLENALHYQANSFSSMILWNENNKFESAKLPYQAQLAPIQDFILYDYDADGDQDIIAAGNWFVAEVETPRADSGVGFVLENLGGKEFKYLDYQESGFFANKDVRSMALINRSASQAPIILVGNNNDRLDLYTPQK